MKKIKNAAIQKNEKTKEVREFRYQNGTGNRAL